LRRFEVACGSNWLADKVFASTSAAVGSSSSNVPQPPHSRSPRKSQRQQDATATISGEIPLELIKILPDVLDAIEKQKPDANSCQPAPGKHPKCSPCIESETVLACYAEKIPALQASHSANLSLSTD
jgi:hypothetical protein